MWLTWWQERNHDLFLKIKENLKDPSGKWPRVPWSENMTWKFLSSYKASPYFAGPTQGINHASKSQKKKNRFTVCYFNLGVAAIQIKPCSECYVCMRWDLGNAMKWSAGTLIELKLIGHLIILSPWPLLMINLISFY